MPKKDILDMIETGMGPMTLDIPMAIKLGWSRQDILDAERILGVVVRGISLSIDLRNGISCEFCQGRDPSLPDDERRCISCKRKNKRVK